MADRQSALARGQRRHCRYRPRPISAKQPDGDVCPQVTSNLRPVCLLHPIDLLIYSALTLVVKDDLESERIPIQKRRVFSYRASPETNRFYAQQPTFQDFRNASRPRLLVPEPAL